MASQDRLDHRLALAAESVRDPVCGMIVESALVKYRLEHDGRSFLFCSARCGDKFRANRRSIRQLRSR